MDALDALIQGPWQERGLLLVPAAFRNPEARRPAELSFLRTRITYSELFGVPPTWDQFFEKIRGLGLRHVMASLSYLNSVLHVKGTLNAQDDLVNSTFDNDLKERVRRLPNWRGRVIYSPSQVLMVMKAAVLNSPDQDDARPDDAYGRELAEVLLIANDLLDPETTAAVRNAQTPPELIAAFLAHSIRSTLANSTERYEHALARASILFTQIAVRGEILARTGGGFVDVNARFVQLTGLSLDDYFAVGLSIVGWFRNGVNHPQQVDQRKLSPATFFSQTRLDPAIGVSLLERLTHDLPSVQQAFAERGETRLYGYDVVPFMRRPMYRIVDDVAVPASLAFLESRVTNGVYWILFDAAATAREKLGISAFYGHLLEAYVRDAIQRALPDGVGLARRVFGDFTYDTPQGEARTSDLTVLYPGAAVFMEVTTTRLGMDATVLMDDPDAVNKDLEKIVIKKARQLDQQIRNFRLGRFGFDGVASAHLPQVMPVVVTGDSIPIWTTTMGTINSMVQDMGLLQGVGIGPLRVIGVDEVEMLEPLMHAGHSLYDILRSHADDAEYRNVSLHNFLHARYRVPMNESLRSGLDAIGLHAGQLLFGRDIRMATQEAVAPPYASHDQIARRAFELFERRGSSHGHDVDDWLQAERDLLTSSAERQD